MHIKLLLPCLFVFSLATAQKKPYLLVGTYTSGKSEGIYVYTFNSSTAENKLVSVAKIKNPSYLAVSPNKKNVYSVIETSDTTGAIVGGGVAAFSFDATTGKLTDLGSHPSGGKDPCYVSVDHTGKFVFAANYSSGSLAMFPVAGNGSIEKATQVIQQVGTGPDKERQEGPHVHATVVSPDNKYLFAPNLGTDKVTIYTIDHHSGKLTPAPKPFVATAPGSGPRHLTFASDKKYAYLMEEMSGNVIAYDYHDGKLKQLQSISCLQKDFTGVTGAADIHISPDGKFLYCSNRGDANLITIFSINKKDGKLTVAGYQSSLGKGPRNFNFDPSGNYLLVANQNSDEVVIFKIDKKTGLLTDTGKRIEVGNPVCIKWID